MKRSVALLICIVFFSLYSGWYFFSSITNNSPEIHEPREKRKAIPIYKVPEIAPKPGSISVKPVELPLSSSKKESIKLHELPELETILSSQERQAIPEFFTIQVSSSRQRNDADRDFQALLNLFAKEGVEQLRIEYVQNYYTVRIGRFHDSKSGRKLFKKIRPLYKSARLFSAYIIPERIKKNITLKSSDVVHLQPAQEKEKVVSLHIGSEDAADIVPVLPEPHKIARKKKEKHHTGKISSDFLLIIDKDDRGRKIRNPMNLFFDKKTDELYLVDAGSQRVIVYGADYFPQSSLGLGRNISLPSSGAVDPQGNIYICQRGTSGQLPVITVLNGAYLLKQEIKYRIIKGAENFTAQACAIGMAGKIYLAGDTDRRILILNNKGKFLKWLEVTEKSFNGEPGLSDVGASQNQVKQFVPIRNITTDSEGNIFFLSEETSKIYVYDSEEKPLFTFGKKGGGPRKLSRPRSVSIDEEFRCIYVVDYMRHTVVVFDINGRVISEIGGKGHGSGWFNFPVDGQVGARHQFIVADYFNKRLQVFEIHLTGELPLKDPEIWQ